MLDRFRPALPFRVGDRVRTFSGQVGHVERIQSTLLTIRLESGETVDVSAVDAVLQEPSPNG